MKHMRSIPRRLPQHRSRFSIRAHEFLDLRRFSYAASRCARSSELTSKQIGSLRARPSRLWETIHSTAEWGQSYRYGDIPEETGLSRLTLSDTDKQARDWFIETTRSLGCQVTIDAIGNIFAVRPGRSNAAPATFVGSHLDSQPMGGRFDGVLGVCAGIEMLNVLRDNDIETEGPIGVVNWTNEEGARFPVSMMGSGVWAEVRDLQETYALQEVLASNEQPRTVLEELERIGYRGATKAHWNYGVKLGGHLELHIEQGPYLEKGNEKVGAVQGVQAYKWFEVTVKGQSAHTGATGYEFRADALHWTSRIILEVREIAQRFSGLASVGVIISEPQSVNTVPDRVTFSLDVRHANDHQMSAIVNEIQNFLPEVESLSRSEGSVGVSVDLKETFHSPATVFDQDAVQCIEESAKALLTNDQMEPKVRKMVSGAGHDSVNTQRHCPTAMVFVPCRNGVSHNPKEWCSKEDCAFGTSVLLQALLRLDRMRYGKGHFGQ